MGLGCLPSDGTMIKQHNKKKQLRFTKKLASHVASLIWFMAMVSLVTLWFVAIVIIFASLVVPMSDNIFVKWLLSLGIKLPLVN